MRTNDSVAGSGGTSAVNTYRKAGAYVAQSIGTHSKSNRDLVAESIVAFALLPFATAVAETSNRSSSSHAHDLVMTPLRDERARTRKAL